MQNHRVHLSCSRHPRPPRAHWLRVPLKESPQFVPHSPAHISASRKARVIPIESDRLHICVAETPFHTTNLWQFPQYVRVHRGTTTAYVSCTKGHREKPTLLHHETLFLVFPV